MDASTPSRKRSATELESGPLVTPPSKDALVTALLSKKDLSPSDTLFQTEAMELFHLEWEHIRGLRFETRENPQSPNFADMKLYSARDIARRVIELYGPTGENPIVIAAKMAEEREREAKEERIQERAKRIKATAGDTSDPVEQLCRKMGFTPEEMVYKTIAMDTFNLKPWHLKGLDAVKVPNPRNPKFKPGQKYKAAAVAAVALKHNTVK